MKPQNNTFHYLGFIALAFAGFAANSAHADITLANGHTIIDTAGDPALGIISRSAGATANFNTAGTATATGTSLTNGILPWATVGTGTSTRFATLSGNDVVGYTGATISSTNNATWGGNIPSGGGGTINYDITANGTGANTGLARNVNSIRYTGSGFTQQSNTSGVVLLTTNAILNAGTGTFAVGGTNGFTLNVGIGSTNELVLHAANANILIRHQISGAAGAGITVVGPNTVTLDGVSTYTGATHVNSGTLALGAAGSINNTSGVHLGTGGTFDVSAKSGYTVSNLSGSGTVTGALTISTQLDIGNSPGTVNFSSDLIIGSGATYLYEMVGGGSLADLGDVAGGLTLTGSILDLVQLGTYTQGDKFTLFAYDGTLTGTFDGLADDSTFIAGGGEWRIDYNDPTAGLNGGISESNTYVTITAIPEPGAALLGGLGVLAMLRRRRTR